LLEIIRAATGPNQLPAPCSIKLDLASCADRCAVSRMHLAKILQAAEERGYVFTDGKTRAEVRLSELLIGMFLEWAATQFLFFADCVNSGP